MLLTALCVRYGEGRRLPQDRHDLYDKIVSNVLFNRYKGEEYQRSAVRGRLAAITYGTHTGEIIQLRRTTEAGLDRTSPVGLFPRSRQQALGIEDMAGNVWEWCKYGSPDDITIDDSGESRVLRGGSCFNCQAFAGTVECHDAHPNCRRGLIGFRVVRASPSADHGSADHWPLFFYSLNRA